MSLPSFLTNPDPNIYHSDNYVALDFETTNIEKGSALNPKNRIVLAVWRDKNGYRYRWGGELDMAPLVEACNGADFLVAHNAKFELQWLHRCGYDVGSRPVFDTMVGEWVHNGNKPVGLFASLDDCLQRRGYTGKDSTVAGLIKAGVCPSDIPRSLLLKYCVGDVIGTDHLFKAQLAECEGTRLLPVIFTRCLATPVLADIERNGLHLDSSRVEEEYLQTMVAYTEACAEMDALTGGINHKSPIQVAHFVYGELGFEELCDKQGNPIRNAPSKQFPDGQPKTNEETLLSLRATKPKQKRFIQLKKDLAKLSSALDKNLSLFVGACREYDSMIYGELNQCSTVTHRLASSGRRMKFEMFPKMKGCQFQNLPRKYKKLFSARKEDWLIGEVDGSQLEFRVAGDLGNDATIKKEIDEGYDVHSYTQQVINAAGKQKISRTAAKKHTFKPLYGGQSGTKAEKAYYQAFADKYHELVFTQEGWCLDVAETKRLVTPWGFVFHWPQASVSVTKYGKPYLNVRTSVMNAPIQCLATAEIIPIALVYFWHRSRNSDIVLVNTVHDSIIAEFPASCRELFLELGVQCLTHDVYQYLHEVYNYDFKVPLGVGFKIGKHWGELPEGEEEISVSVPSPY